MTTRLPEPPSAGVLLDAVPAERQVRLESIDSMTSKAGIILGFTGTIVALTPLLTLWPLRLLVFIPAGLAIRSCLEAIATVLLPGLKPEGLREELSMQEPRAAQLQILDYFTARHGQLVQTPAIKAGHVSQAARWLVINCRARISEPVGWNLMSDSETVEPPPASAPPPPPIKDNPAIGEYFEKGEPPSGETKAL